ncbi:hypothetical protein AB0C70_25195 [Streptomyces sp. NPDC048564]|uniref:hypothetical protein n=1 Tax=Streptomyces sp. NPDC048564 TaxID=3155760 RepID=UPI0034387893
MIDSAGSVAVQMTGRQRHGAQAVRVVAVAGQPGRAKTPGKTTLLRALAACRTWHSDTAEVQVGVRPEYVKDPPWSAPP